MSEPLGMRRRVRSKILEREEIEEVDGEGVITRRIELLRKELAEPGVGRSVYHRSMLVNSSIPVSKGSPGQKTRYGCPWGVQYV